jgi:hypothetical protein
MFNSKSTEQYNKLVNYYNLNKGKKWDEWLEYDKTFKKPGKQGLVGLLKLKDDNSDLRYVFKISQYINYLTEHESSIMTGLNELAEYCPHFCKFVGNITCTLDPNNRKGGNPFDINCKYPIEKNIILTEYISDSYKFYDYIKSKHIHEDILYSTIKQVLMSVSIAQKVKNFSHYDLHSLNIMMRKCDTNVVFLYALDEDNQFCVPTLGHYPVVIDFGFSYIENLENNPLWPSMCHTDVGFMSNQFDPLADPKLFLVAVSSDIKEHRNTKKSKNLRTIVHNLFDKLDIDWEAGWDNTDEQGASYYVLEMLQPYNKNSVLFRYYDHYCIDLLQSLIILPLQEQEYSDIDKVYTTFLQQWIQIENEISNPFYSLYTLKGIIDAVREVRSYYIEKKTRNDAINKFRQNVYNVVNKISKFCRLKNVHFEKLLCSLIMLSRNIEGMLYDIVTTRMRKKNKEYKKLPLNNIEKIYGAIDMNITDNYVYNKDTVVYIFNLSKKCTDKYKIPEENLESINKAYPITRGALIYDIYKNSI